jgi:hypothetical protein
MSSPQEQTIERFYRALAACDGDGMAACYAPDVHFSGPVFPDLNGGKLLGWTPIVKGTVRKRAAASLAKFTAG